MQREFDCPSHRCRPDIRVDQELMNQLNREQKEDFLSSIPRGEQIFRLNELDEVGYIQHPFLSKNLVDIGRKYSYG